MQHNNRMAQQDKSGKGKVKKGKRNKAKVVAERWDKKDQVGRVVQESKQHYLAPPVTAKNNNQKLFLAALKDPEIQAVVFIAPAGVGKSFVGMSEVSDWLKKGIYDKIILSRPAVGMGKNTIGLLKGGMREKYEPYLLPLVDVMTNRYGKGWYEHGLSCGTLEFLPLEYVRGRNISQVAVVDEFQNCTPDEAYTMLTRIATGGKLLLLGDHTQTDLKGENALTWLPKFLNENPELKAKICLIEATSDDIERGGLCKMMVKAKERSKL